MPKYEFLQVDAFTETPLKGNPCAVIFNTDDMDEELMLEIAREMNLSETAFVRRSNVADFGVRYFTPAEEIPLAGHPTISTAKALVDSGRLKLSGNKTTFSFELKAGLIEVSIFSSNGRIDRITMEQMKPQFLKIYKPENVMPIFGISPKDKIPNVPIQTVSTGTPQLMIPVRNIEALKNIKLDIPAFSSLRRGSDFFSPHLFCLEGISSEGRTFARHFGVPPDTPEDPVTGSATGGMAAYLWHYGLIDEPSFTAEQGHWMNRPGQIFVEIQGPKEDIQSVKIGGRAVTVMSGFLKI